MEHSLDDFISFAQAKAESNPNERIVYWDSRNCAHAQFSKVTNFNYSNVNPLGHTWLEHGQFIEKASSIGTYVEGNQWAAIARVAMSIRAGEHNYKVLDLIARQYEEGGINAEAQG